MKKLIAILFCILCAGLIFAKGNGDSPSKKKVTAEPHKVQEQTASEGASILDKYSDAEIEVLLANISSLTFPNGTSYNLASDNMLIAVHELEHQSQYQNGDKKEVFETLVNEALDKASGKSDPYNTSGTLEYKAQQVQERAGAILKSRGA